VLDRDDFCPYARRVRLSTTGPNRKPSSRLPPRNRSRWIACDASDVRFAPIPIAAVLCVGA